VAGSEDLLAPRYPIAGAGASIRSRARGPWRRGVLERDPFREAHHGKQTRVAKMFNLTRQFALLSFLCIVLISATMAFLLSRFLTDALLARDANVSMEFIDSIVQAEGTWNYFIADRTKVQNQGLESFFNHVAHIPDVVRANVYSADYLVLWSSDSNLIDERFTHN